MLTPHNNAEPQPQPQMEQLGGPIQEVDPRESGLIMGIEEEDSIIQDLEAHLDQIPEDQKAFLAEHMTPEFVRAIGIINGPEVASYLNQFADDTMVLVPVPREIAEQHLAAQGQQGQLSAPQQGPSLMAPQSQPTPATPQ